MKKKLQYTHSLEFPPGVHFQHEWKLEHAHGEDIDTLRDMVAWCHEHWNDDPNFDHEWHYRFMGEIHYFFSAKDSTWHTWESPIPSRFYFGTNDDEWAVAFKLTWSEAIQQLT